MLYGDDSKGIIRLDPRTKLLIFFASSVLSLHSFRVGPLIVYGMILCALIALCGRKASAFWSYATLLAALYIRGCIYAQGRSAGVTGAIVSGLISVYLFTYPVILSFYLLSKTTRISQFMAAFQAMRIPVKAIIPLAVFFRFVPSVSDEWKGIRKAMSFRGISMEPFAIVRSPLKTIEYILIPLLFSSVSVMEEIAAAALARGIDSDKKRSSYEIIRLRAADYIVMALFILLIVYVFTFGKTGL